jgi:hypothetical protein
LITAELFVTGDASDQYRLYEVAESTADHWTVLTASPGATDTLATADGRAEDLSSSDPPPHPATTAAMSAVAIALIHFVMMTP